MRTQNAERRTQNAERRTRIALSISALAVASTALLISCRKDIEPASATGSDVTPRVRAFVERALSNVQAKDNTAMGLDSAEWYIEAGLNYTESQVWLEYNDHAIDSLETTIQIEGGLIASSDAQAAYRTLRGQVDELITPEVNHLVLADVAFLPTGEPGLLNVKVLLHLGSGYAKNVHAAYGPNDYWGYGTNPVPNNNCGCGPNAGGAGPCADVKIQNRVRSAIGLPADGCFWHSVVTRGVNWGGLTGVADINYPLSSFPTNNASMPYMLYRCAGFNCSNCFSPTMMSFYTQKAWDLMLLVKPTGKNPSTVIIDDIAALATGGNPPAYYHMALFSYGNLQCPPK